MSKKKQGVKKGSAQAKCYAARKQAEAEQQYTAEQIQAINEMIAAQFKGDDE